MRRVGLAVSVVVFAFGSLAIVPSADAFQTEFVDCLERSVCQTVTGHGCFIAGVGGWPPEPRINPDCIGTTSEQPPEASSSSPGNSTEDSK